MRGVNRYREIYENSERKRRVIMWDGWIEKVSEKVKEKECD